MCFGEVKKYCLIKEVDPKLKGHEGLDTHVQVLHLRLDGDSSYLLLEGLKGY